jgi:hypothetical protein
VDSYAYCATFAAQVTTTGQTTFDWRCDQDHAALGHMLETRPSCQWTSAGLPGPRTCWKTRSTLGDLGRGELAPGTARALGGPASPGRPRPGTAATGSPTSARPGTASPPPGHWPGLDHLRGVTAAPTPGGPSPPPSGRVPRRARGEVCGVGLRR